MIIGTLMALETCLILDRWPVGWGPALGRVPNLRVCEHLPRRVAHAGGEGRTNILPWYRLVGVAIPPVSREGGRTGLPKKGKWSPRGTGTTVLTYPCPTASRVSVAVRESARVTGKAGENGQHSGEVGAAQPGQDRRLPGATSVRSRVGIVLEDGSGVAIEWVTGRSYYSARRRLNVQSGQRKD